MGSPSEHEITALLQDWSRGDQQALEKLMPLVYDELRKTAAGYLRRESAGHTLQTAALVNETYLRLVRQEQASWRDRVHFFAIAAQMMRRILVDHARSRRYAKRGGNQVKLPLESAREIAVKEELDVLTLDEALSVLAEKSERHARVVELRFFGGFTKEETAEALGVSPSTVARCWRLARAWLHSYVTKGLAAEI